MDKTISVTCAHIPNGRYGGFRIELLAFDGAVLQSVSTPPFDVTSDTPSTPTFSAPTLN